MTSHRVQCWSADDKPHACSPELAFSAYIWGSLQLPHVVEVGKQDAQLLTGFEHITCSLYIDSNAHTRTWLYKCREQGCN